MESAERPFASTARAVVVAAGNATRMGGAGGARKPLIEIDGRTLLEHACASLAASERVSSIVLVCHADDIATIRGLLAGSDAFGKVVAVIAGGAERADSVRLGCTALPEGDEPAFDLVCIHDAARPFVSPAAIDRVVAAAARDGGALLAVPVRDTIKRSTDGEHASETVDRSELFSAQTPQVFERARFLTCLDRAAADAVGPTDDSALWERYVGPVTLVAGEARAAKITGPEDLDLARALYALASTKNEGER